jgi:hypothetical protein
MIFFKAFFSKKQEIVVIAENNLNQLQIEAKILEREVNSCVNEKAELEKLLADFQYKHTIELGNIILEILRIKQAKFNINTQEFRDAEADANKYDEQFNKEKKRHLYNLNETEKLELKRQFRKASFLCHPDKIVDELKDEANKIFCDLKSAYEANDLDKVSDILSRLESGHFFSSISDSVSEKEKLLTLIESLKKQILELGNEITEIKNSDSYKTIIVIDDIDAYLQKTKENLLFELNELKK